MEHYTAIIETTKRGNPTLDEVDAAMSELEAWHPSVSVTPRGHRAVRVTFPADSFRQAFDTARMLATTIVPEVLGGRALRVDLTTEAEANARAGLVEVPELIGVGEAAPILGVSPQRVRQMIDEGKLAGHRVGERTFVLVREEVERLTRA